MKTDRIAMRSVGILVEIWGVNIGLFMRLKLRT